MTRHYSAVSLLKEGLNAQKGWRPAWRNPEPRKPYDVVIIDGGGQGLPASRDQRSVVSPLAFRTASRLQTSMIVRPAL